MGGKASIWWRLGASCIEGILLFSFLGISVALAQFGGAMGAVLIVIAWLCLFVWSLVLMARGSSIGKSFTGLRVVHARTGEPIGFWRMFFRQTIGQTVSGFVSGLGHLWAIIDADQQCWHDKLFDTLVVEYEPRPVLRGRSRGFQPAISLSRRQAALAAPRHDEEGYEEAPAPRRRPRPQTFR